MMNKEMYWLGCDIGKKTFGAAIVAVSDSTSKWSDLPFAEFERSVKGCTELIAWLKGLGVGRDQFSGICIESTGCYSRQWVEFLKERLGPVSIVNPRQPKRFKEMLQIQGKSDRIDSAVCALFGRTMEPTPTELPSGAQGKLREQNRLYLKLEEQLNAFQNRLDCDPTDKAARAVLRAIVKTLKREMKKLQTAMTASLAEDEALQKDANYAQSIPGVGPRTVQTIFGEFGDLRTYTRNQLGALAGLYPREYTSGSSVYKKPCLVKGGGGRVRKVLYMAAMAARTHNPHLREFAERLKAKGKNPMAVLGAIMHKLLLLIRAVVVSGKAYDPQYGKSNEA